MWGWGGGMHSSTELQTGRERAEQGTLFRTAEWTLLQPRERWFPDFSHLTNFAMFAQQTFTGRRRLVNFSESQASGTTCNPSAQLRWQLKYDSWPRCEKAIYLLFYYQLNYQMTSQFQSACQLSLARCQDSPSISTMDSSRSYPKETHTDSYHLEF